MKKCNDCGATKGLKSGWVDDSLDGLRNCCFCKKCFFDNEYSDEDVSHVTKENWDDHDYHWNLKNTVEVEGS